MAYIPRFIKDIKITEGMKDLDSIFFAIFGALPFTNQPANKGRKSATANSTIISMRGIWNFSTSTKKYTREGKTDLLNMARNDAKR